MNDHWLWGFMAKLLIQVQVLLTGQEEQWAGRKGQWDRFELRLIHWTHKMKGFLLTHIHDCHNLRQCCTNLLWPLGGFPLEQGVSPTDLAEWMPQDSPKQTQTQGHSTARGRTATKKSPPAWTGVPRPGRTGLGASWHSGRCSCPWQL